MEITKSWGQVSEFTRLRRYILGQAPRFGRVYHRQGGTMSIYKHPYILILQGLILLLFCTNTSLAEVTNDTNATYAQTPINLSGNDVAPLVMLNMSRDHQLSYKAYNDYSDLDGDDNVETTYDDTISYYGYFDSTKCYSYDTGDDRFEPAATATGTNDHYCSSQWSGNFMNWATMTRMDVVRKLLYGGMRSTDTSTLTVLERQFLPTDAHSFAKFYDGSDIDDLTPFSVSEITIANFTHGSSSGSNQWSETNTQPPIIRVAEGNHALWAANERWQCYWSEEKSASNGNNPATSGLTASSSNPSRSKGLGSGIATGDYVARVEACNSSLLGEEKCREYNGNYKPVGLLQIYGEGDQISFGLMTGSYTKNSSGGVLRKNATSFKDEINTTDGTFISVVDSIVDNLNKIRMYGYDYNSGVYTGSHDSCNYQQTSLVLSGGSTSFGKPANEGNCSSWGNPMSEIYLESLRYLAGKSATSAFTYGAGSKDAALGLTIASWSDPLGTSNYCAPLNVLNFNASVSGNDNDQMGGVTDLATTSSASALTDTVGVEEGIDGSSWFISNNGVSSDDLCTSKDIGSGFGSYSGLCPEGPTQKGTYLMSGVAYHANTEQIRTDLTIPPSRSDSRDLMVTTYGIALSTNVPKIEVTVNDKTVTILPAFRLQRASAGDPYGSGGLVDFKIISKTATYGKFYVNWEVSAMGGDYDQDVWGTIEYFVSGNTIRIQTDSIAQSASREQGFGYTISGTDHDGAHFHSGQNGFYFTDPTGVLGCNNCTVGNGPTSVTYNVTGSSAGILEDVLWYTAKYGGFIDENDNQKPDDIDEWDAINNSDGTPGADGLPDNYFFATNPLQLENALNRVFLNILQRASSGTAAAVVSNNVSGVGALYQAYYEPSRQDVNNKSVSWIGTVQALWLDSYGLLREDGDADAVLDDYVTDPVIEQFHDELANKTRIRRYESTDNDVFTPHFMQGQVTAYNASTGVVTFIVDETSNSVGDGPFTSWTVSNLLSGDAGTSTTSSTITGITASKTFTVVPNGDWIAIGDVIMVSHFETSEDDFENVRPLWNARKELSFDTAIAEDQRAFTSPARGDLITGGRFIKTWVDDDDDGVVESTDGNGVVDPGEYIDFDNIAITATNYGIFNVATEAEADNVVDFTRGKEMTGSRNRTIDYDGTGDKVIRLADVVNATPTIVGDPQEALHLLYKDDSYAKFKKQYRNRRQVLYVGSNGGMLHAFNGGFYDTETQSFLISDGSSAAQHPLGAEIWAYVPMNLLPHLKWLKDPDYQHMYYVDGKPNYFDVKIFSDDGDHPGGWGTILVVGMRFGGGKITVDTGLDTLGVNSSTADNRVFSSAYIIMDVTNPEVEPTLLGEIQLPDNSFTTSYPAALAVKDQDSILDENKWFLTFGSGPSAIDGNSTVSAKLYVLDLAELVNPGTINDFAPGCANQKTYGTSGLMNIMVCDTGVAASFVGDPISVDWDLDYKADSIYFGLVGDDNSTSGRVMVFNTNEDASPTNWSAPTTFINTSQPVVAGVTPGIDELDQKWIFFGTGRLFVSNDQLSTATQSIYGVKQKGSLVTTTELVNVSSALVETDTEAVSGVTGATTFDTLEAYIETSKEGWFQNLPPIQGSGTVPATRVINSSALAGSVLFTAAYQPGLDLCTGEGYSRLYGSYYRTGTAYPDPAILGTYDTTSGGTTTTYSRNFVELGQGFATAPSLHSGSGSGPNAVSVFTQLSTGTVSRQNATTITNIRSGILNWTER